MPIDSRFLNSAKDKARAVARAGQQFVSENRRLSLGAGAAMLIAPAVFRNDNRGYMQTASVTTPLITAATYATPSILGSFRSNFAPHVVPAARRAAEGWKAAKDRKGVSYEDVMRGTRDYEAGVNPLNVYKDQVNRFHAGRTRATPDLQSEIGALLGTGPDKPGILDRVLNKTNISQGELKYLSNAIHAEKMRTLSAAEQVAYKSGIKGVGSDPFFVSPMPRVAPVLTRDGIRSAIVGQMGNASFIRGMNSRLQRMENYSFFDEGLVGNTSRISGYSTSRWGSSNLMTARMKSEHPALFAELNKLSSTPGFKPSDLSVITLEDDAKTIAAIRYRGVRGVTIPVVQQDRTVLLGSSFQNVGTARLAYTSDAVMASDVYGLSALGRGKSVSAVRRELQRFNLFGQVRDSDDFIMSALPENANYATSKLGHILKSKTAAPSRLFGFVNITPEGVRTEGVGYSKLNAASKLASDVEVQGRHGFTAVGSEGSKSKGVFELAETRMLEFFGMSSTEKQDPTWRSVTKDVRLTEAPSFPRGNLTKVRDSLSPFSQTDYLSKVAPGVNPRGVGLRKAGITGGEKTLFGDMPKTVEGLAAYADYASNIIAKQQRVSDLEARKMWMEMSNWLSAPENLRSFNALHRLGSLGEGGVLMSHGLHGLSQEWRTEYELDEIRGDWQKLVGLPLPEEAGKKSILGYFGGNEVVAGGHTNILEDVVALGGGKHKAIVREMVPLATGSKIDFGVKGLVEAVDPTGKDMGAIRTGLNKLYDIMGTGGFIPNEVDAIAVAHYAQNKESPLRAALDTTGDLFRRLEESGETDAVSQYMLSLENQGVIYDKGTVTFETAAMNTEEGIDLQARALSTIEKMFADVSDQIRKGRIQGDEFMRRFAGSSEYSNYAEWTHRYADPGTMFAWDTTQRGLSSETKATFDMLDELARKGHHGAVSEIRSRLSYTEGDPNMTSELDRYLQGETGAITQTRELSEIVGSNKGLRRLGTSEGRAGTLMDPGAAPENYLARMPDGTTVPVLGHDSYGNRVNRFGADFSATDQEKSFAKLARLYENGTPSEKAVSQARQAYMDSLKQIVFGKNSYRRAAGVDKAMGVSGWITHRPSSLRYDDGAINPFELFVGRDTVAKIRDAKVREALYNGESVFGVLGRHPISSMPFYKVSIDDTLNGTNLFGIDEAARGLHLADQDKDPGYLFMMRHGGEGHQEGMSMVFGKDSLQAHELANQRALEGIGDDPRAFFTTAGADVGKLGHESFFEALKNKELPGKPWITPAGIDEALRARSTSGTIGAFSNTLTQMLVGLDYNQAVTKLDVKSDLSRLFFSTVRQTPISASKLKNVPKGHPERALDSVKALQINKALQESLGEGGTAQDFISAMNQLATAADANKGTTYRDMMSANYETLVAYHGGMDRRAVAQATKAITTSPNVAASARALGMDEGMLPYIQAAFTDPAQAARAAARSTGAEMGAEAVGLLNRATRAASEMGGALREGKAGLVLGAGVAIAAAASLMTGSINQRGARAVFRGSSGSKFRPEEMAGVPDQAPGGAWQGSRASRPARNMVGAPAQTSTAMVAPIRETSDLDVQIRSKDRSRAHETAKMLGRMATDGDSNITINYRNAKRSSIRYRERMRDALES